MSEPHPLSDRQRGSSRFRGALALMKRHRFLLFILLIASAGVALSLRAQTNDPLAADRPVGPVKPAIYEPAVKGVYLGASLDTSQVRGDAAQWLTTQMGDFNKLAGKKQALYLHFLQFPNEKGAFGGWDRDANGWVSAATFAGACDRVGATPVLTLEPMVPRALLDWRPGSPAYEATKAFAQGAGAWNKPVFIRFGHEMNGSWYPWGEWIDKNENQVFDPEEATNFSGANYVTAYRNVASMFRSYAPKAALMWCPNSGLVGGGRRDPFRRWYPGDDVVDWVGLDVYERGFFLPKADAHLWGGQFAYNLTHDAADDPNTPANESVGFYSIYAQVKRKPIMICETAATQSFRTDLTLAQRSQMTRDWKIGYWNDNEYGWMQNVYGTSLYKGQKFLHPLDVEFPMVKGVLWFQIAKREDVSGRSPGQPITKFKDAWLDYRIGGGAAPDDKGLNGPREADVYRSLTGNSYFLSDVQMTNLGR
ncbi:hypothetical protein IAD21_03243 [Abditibacteriota bacterium]|nr:hypothetical protein IAD21_03243 [Abditibacteriota bacterium]